MDKIKYSKKLNAIIDGVIVSPEKVVATFSDEYHEKAKRQLIINHDHGTEMLYAYEQYRNNMHILNVCDMLKKMEEIYAKYSYQTYENKKKDSNFIDEIINEEEKCRCGGIGTREKHTCPYAEDIGGNYEAICNCCDRCQGNCAQDI